MKNKQERKTNKIELDKYYTPLETAKYCINKTFEIIGRENITEIIEPSAGAGSFSLQIENCIAYDIKPEHPSIIEQDYLKLELDYKKGRLIIGNPPFGKGGKRNGYKTFFIKSIKESDYISYILPINQLNNSKFLYEFDLIYSEDIGTMPYSNTPVHCCLNIYKRPLNGLNKCNQIRPEKLIDVKIMNVSKGKSRKDKIPVNFDFCMSTFGSIGTQCFYPYQYSQQMYFLIKNKQLREKILNLLKNTDWNNLILDKKIPRLCQWQVIKYLKKMIPEIQ